MTKLFDSSCTRCDLSSNATSVCIPSSGPGDADILFFGEAPGATEDRDNEVFVGQAGSELDGLLGKAKLERERIRISNVCRCRPPRNATPKVSHVQACSYYTIRELQLVQPRVIVALGGSALKALTGQSAVGANRGKLLPLLPAFRSDVRVIPTYHPASYAHQPQNRVPFRAAIIEDMKLARKVARGAKLDALVVTGLDGDEAMDFALGLLATADRIACDLEWERIETTRELKRGKKGDPITWPWSSRRGRDPRAVSISIAARIDGKLVAVAVPLLRTGFADLRHRHRIRRLLALLPSFYHSATGDLIWLYSRGWEVRLAGCTLVLAGLLGIEGSRSLAALAGRMTKMPADWKLADDPGSVPRTDEEWREKLVYNGRDTVATVLVLEAEERRMRRKKREALLPLYEDVLLPAISILARASLAGVPIDEQYLADLYTADKETVETLTAKVGELLNIQGDVSSVVANSAQLGPYIEKATGVVLPETKRGTSVTKDILAQLRNEHPAIRVEMKRRKAQSRINNNWRPWSALLAEQGDSRLHTIFKQDVARSGRTSAESEAGHTFQQMLRGSTYRGIVRARKNWRIGSIDQSQIELRGAAWMANEKKMLEMFQNGEDLHLRLAMEVNHDQAVRDAELLLVRIGLPPDGASATILQELSAHCPQRAEPLLRIQEGRSHWADQNAGSRKRGESTRSYQSELERRLIGVYEVSEDYVRAVQKYAKRSCPPSGSKFEKWGSLKHRDAMSILSCARAWSGSELQTWSELRTRAKAIGFGFLYGMGERRFVQQAMTEYGLQFTIQQAQQARDSFFSFYPALLPWHDSCWKYVEQGWVSTPTHRIRPLVLTENEDADGLHRKAINTPVQNFATDLSQLCMVYTEEQLLKEYGRHLPDVWEVVGFFHDAEQFHYDRREGATIKEIVQDAWEHPPLEERLGIEFPIPLKAEISSGRRWKG